MSLSPGLWVDGQADICTNEAVGSILRIESSAESKEVGGIGFIDVALLEEENFGTFMENTARGVSFSDVQRLVFREYSNHDMDN